ncbi:MAG: hypothetical protein KDK41_11960 [Leptospiraceae bacterium]|nr:hypothetical protein [Leptospiraceae bacterium]
MKNNLETLSNAKEAIASLPKPYQSIDDEFLKTHADAIDTLKEAYADKGGIHLLRTDEGDAVIVRVPSSQILKKSRKDVERIKDPIEQDLALLTDCLLYPEPAVVRQWIDTGSPGIASTYSRKLLELSKTVVEVEAKKL